MTGRLDRIDLKILRLLQNSGRLTNAELAETAGVSAATCHRRTQRLFDEGFISRVRANVCVGPPNPASISAKIGGVLSTSPRS